MLPCDVYWSVLVGLQDGPLNSRPWRTISFRPQLALSSQATLHEDRTPIFLVGTTRAEPPAETPPASLLPCTGELAPVP